MYNIIFIFLIFFTYSFFGYLIEITAVYVKTKKFTLSRGYLIGPYLPIFGFGSLIIIYALERYSGDYFVLFLSGMVLSGILEYLTSVLMEKLYGLRWWDYSGFKYNINGRVCLNNLIYFGIIGILIVEFINPVIIKFYSSINNYLFIVIGLIIAIVMLVDLIFSALAANDIKNILKNNRNKLKDSTEEIKAEIRKKLESVGFKDYRDKRLNFRTKRIIKAFPSTRNKILSVYKKIKKPK